jgi:hypothetical protein
MRRSVNEGYARLLKTDASPHVIASSYEPTSDLHAECAAIPMHVRLGALTRLADRVRRGEDLVLVLRCACKPGECHGDEIARWVMSRPRASEFKMRMRILVVGGWVFFDRTQARGARRL